MALAQWAVSSLSSNNQAALMNLLTSGGKADHLESLSVGIVEPINVYSQSDRATKYGLLFIGLTFAGFFIFEILKNAYALTLRNIRSWAWRWLYFTYCWFHLQNASALALPIYREAPPVCYCWLLLKPCTKKQSQRHAVCRLANRLIWCSVW